MSLRTAAALAVLALLALAPLCAAPLVLKDDYRSPRNKERPLRKATRLIVLHTTEAHARSSLNKLSERGEAHYCVTEKGEAYRIVDRDREAFHAGRSMWNAKEDCDEFSIGIEVVGWHDKSMPLKQLEALKELVARLKKMYGIADAQVVCHSHVAYGAPNTWHKCKHRGRKRCGMLFAMPSVRAKLGLRARPGHDPDVRAKRLVQADPYLNSVLYGSVDTMVASYGRARPQVAAKPAPVLKPAPAKPAPSKSASSKAASPKAAPARPAPKPVPAKAAVAKGAAPKPAAVRPPARTVVRPVPPPVRKPPLVVPPPAPPPEPAPAAASEQAEDRDWLATLGLKGGYFRKRARLVAPAPETPAAETEPAAPAPASQVLPLPKGLHVGRMGDSVRDLAALAKLPGYTRGGPVNAENSPFRIAGAAWNRPTTYYWGPRGQIVTGDKVDERSVEPGTFIFFKKEE